MSKQVYCYESYQQYIDDSHRTDNDYSITGMWKMSLS